MGWGDELMVTGQARVLQQRDPRKVRVVYETPRWHEAWDHNPRIARPDEVGDFQTLRPRDDYRRPYIAGKTAQQWTWLPWGPPTGELYFSEAESLFASRHAGRIVIEPRLKPAASPNKNWGRARWVELVTLARAAGLQLTQMGPIEKYRLPGVDYLITPTMRYAAAVLSTARAAVLPEGAMHHACAALGTPAVVIFGGYIAPSVTGYPGQRSLFPADARWPLGCGMRVPCPHCERAMASITAADVLHELEELLEKLPRPVAA